MTNTLVASEIKEAKLSSRGKVRDIYDLGDQLLLVATDRLSAFDVVLPTPIPDKGRVLNQISAFWFDWSKGIIDNHLISIDFADFPAILKPYREMLDGRSMLVKKAKRLDAECVVRGYLAGSAWKEYKAAGTVFGRKMPSGMLEAQKLPEPLFTPTSKADVGHDENLKPGELEKLVGAELAKKLEETTIEIFTKAQAYAESKGLILADTKFEFGLLDGKLILIDEMLTPDSSRYWEASTWKPGKTPDNFDKQYVRDYLEKIAWNKQPPGPELPAKVVEKTRDKYLSALKRVTGKA